MSNWLETLKARLDLIGASALLVEDQFAGMLEPVLGAERMHSFDRLLEGPPLQDAPTARPTDVAYLQFTSGSTGASRAASIGHTQILWNACHDFNYTGQLRSDEARALWIPLYHDFGLVSSLAGMFAGAPVILQSPEQFLARPSSWMDMCSRYEAAFTAAPNAGYGVAARDLRLNPRELDLSNLRACINGSEPIDMEVIDKFMSAASKYGIPEKAMSAAYGMAEVTLAITWTRGHELLESVYVNREGIGRRGAHVEQVAPDDPRAIRLARCGKPDEATEIVCLGPDGERLPDWQVGEVHIKGPSVMQGYFNEPEVTAETLRDGWLITGDLGFHVGERELVLCGRIKDMIIVAGRNLYPQDFEFVAERVDGVRKGNAAAFSVPGTEQMVLVLETRASEPEEMATVARAVQERLRDEFDIIAPEVVVVEAGGVPKTSSGKRQRGICRAMYEAGELPVVHTTSG
jgi:fatty-acyl-CoA synthase